MVTNQQTKPDASWWKADTNDVEDNLIFRIVRVVGFTSSFLGLLLYWNANSKLYTKRRLEEIKAERDVQVAKATYQQQEQPKQQAKSLAQ